MIDKEIEYWQQKSSEEQAIHILMDFVDKTKAYLNDSDKRKVLKKRAEAIQRGDGDLLTTINVWI